jgi:hypothetical protein
MVRRILRPLVALTLLLLALPLLAEEQPARHRIDAEVRAAWQREKITPAPRADDAEFLRRIYIDLVGTIPTYDEAVAFLNDTDPKKRDKLIDTLLADPRFATEQAHVWDLVLFGRHPGNIDATRKRDSFKTWLAGQIAKGVPHDQWVRDVLLADQEGSELFQVQFRNAPEEAAVAVSRIFLGTQLQCARCHDHPYEKWTQKDFFGVAGFFVRNVVVEKGSGNMRKFAIGEKSSGDVLFSGKAADQGPGKKGEPIKPKFLGGAVLDEPAVPKDFKEPVLKNGELPPKPAFSRKEKLAAWVTAKDNPWFARAAVNRVWSQFLGRGLVHPVDDLSESNEPTHPELFDALTAGFVANKYDLKWLIREIVTSEAYQLTSKGAIKDALPAWFERGRVRPLSMEELIGCLRTATGWGAQQLPGAMEEYMIRLFGEPTNGQGDFQSSLGEHLFLNNAGQLKQMISGRKGNLAEQLANVKTPIEQRVDRLFLTVLTRKPTAKERAVIEKYLSTPNVKPEALAEEAIWALLNTAEFRFNH